MSLYPPPTANVPVFNPALFTDFNGGASYGSVGVGNFVDYPTAQGAVTWTNGTSTAVLDSGSVTLSVINGVTLQGVGLNGDGIAYDDGTTIQGATWENLVTKVKAIGAITATSDPAVPPIQPKILNVNDTVQIQNGETATLPHTFVSLSADANLLRMNLCQDGVTNSYGTAGQVLTSGGSAGTMVWGSGGGGSVGTLQDVINNSPNLQGTPPSANQIIQYTGGQVVWATPTENQSLQDVLTVNNTATTSVIISNGTDSSTVSSTQIEITNGAGDTNTQTATSITITDTASAGNSTYAFDEVHISGGSGTFTANTTSIMIENGGDTVKIGNGAGSVALGIEVNTVPVLPSVILSGNSNLPVAIPVFNFPHQVILQSNPVPLIDTLTPTIYSIPAGDIPLCYCWTGSYLYMGTQNGSIYYFDGSAWNLTLSFNGEVRCLYWHSPQSRMYIGGSFTDITSPITQTGLNYVCWANSFPTLTSIGVDVWTNYSGNGFNNSVNAITADNTFMYFGGDFTGIYSGGLNILRIACYDWSSSQYIYTIDGNAGNGFDAPVCSIAIANQSLVCCGSFNSLTLNSGVTNVNFCVSTFLNSGFNVGSTSYLYGNPTVLTIPISTYDAVQTDGSTFYISTRDTNIGGAGVNYLLQTPSYSFASVGSIGNNAYNTTQTSWNRNGGITSYGTGDNIYLVNGVAKATLPFPAYLYYNYFYSRQEFVNLNDGSIWIFSNNTENDFVLQASRYINASGTQYTTGWKINTNSGNGYGFTATLVWNGVYYSPISVPYGNGY